MTPTSLVASARTVAAVAACMVAWTATGCATTGGKAWNPFAHVAPVLETDADKSAIVAHLNRNISRCTGWRSTDVRVRTAGLPVTLGASVAVESPRRFHMIVSAINGDQADFGSNDERMWFWSRQDPHKHVYTCGHEEMEAASERLPLPFRPDWLMEVLGVIPIDPAAYELHPCPGDAGVVRLVSEQVAADGRSVRRIMTVDLKRGVVTAHALHDVDGRLIAEARLADHRPDVTSGVVLPHRVELSVADAGADMTLTLGKIDVNPTAVHPRTWEMPRIAGCPVYDLGRGEVVPL